jgi:hypothetical protein
MGVGGQCHASAELQPAKTRYPLYRKLDGPQGRYGRVWKISPPPGFDPRTVQPVASCYTDCAVQTHGVVENGLLECNDTMFSPLQLSSQELLHPGYVRIFSATCLYNRDPTQYMQHAEEKTKISVPSTCYDQACLQQGHVQHET